MTKYEIVKNFYDNRLWSLARIRNAVVMGWITEMEFEEITGIEYAD